MNISLTCLAYRIGLMLSLLFVVNLWTAPSIVRAQAEDSYESEVEKGKDLLRRRRYEDALKSFKRANDMRDKKSAECFYGMAQAYNALAAYKNVVDSCEKIIEFAAGDTALQTQAYNLEGIALQTQAGFKDQKKLQDAEAAFRKALALNIDLPILHYNLGYTLMQLSPELKRYRELQPDNEKAESALKLIENPRRAREPFAPDVSMTTSEGEYVTLEDLHGKIVLLDFWGTWCPPCVASLPALRDLYKRYQKNKSFLMISVSSGDPEERWSAFIARNQMVWKQSLDRDHHVVQAFNVHSFPTYILIDPEGIVRYRTVTTSWERTGELDDAIRKQLKLAAKSATSN